MLIGINNIIKNGHDEKHVPAAVPTAALSHTEAAVVSPWTYINQKKKDQSKFLVDLR